jgi:hypothetical protein
MLGAPKIAWWLLSKYWYKKKNDPAIKSRDPMNQKDTGMGENYKSLKSP